MKVVKILILDDHQIIIDGLQSMLQNEKNYSICSTHLTGIEALKGAMLHNPDIIITDMMMPDMNGVDFIKNIRSNNLKSKILILSMCISFNIIQEAIDAGANGFIMKQNANRDELVKAIDLLMRGKNYFKSVIAKSSDDKIKSKDSPKDATSNNLNISVLSKNELQVLRLFSDGFSIKEISKKLNLNVSTIEKYKSNIMTKLQLKSNVDLIKFAIKNNICQV